jgi:uncharacterized membrane-anchored protein
MHTHTHTYVYIYTYITRICININTHIHTQSERFGLLKVLVVGRLSGLLLYFTMNYFVWACRYDRVCMCVCVCVCVC